MSYLFEKLFRKYENIIQNRDVIITLKENMEISFEFAEYFYETYLQMYDNYNENYLNFWFQLGSTTAYSEEFINNHLERDWSWYYISLRKNLSKNFVVKHRDKFLDNNIYENFKINSEELYEFFYNNYSNMKDVTLDSFLVEYKLRPDDLLVDKFLFEDYDEKYYPLISHISLIDYFNKFGIKSLKEFIKKYADYINIEFFNLSVGKNKDDSLYIISKLVIKYLPREKLQNKTILKISKKLYEKYRYKLSSLVTPRNIYDLTLSDILENYWSFMDEYDYDFYTENRLTESGLEYLVDNDLISFGPIEGRYYLNWKNLKNNDKISRSFLDKYRHDPRYNWYNIGKMYNKRKYYTMEEYRKNTTISLFQVRKINYQFIKEHEQFYSKHFKEFMIDKLTDDIAEFLIQNGFDIFDMFSYGLNFLSIEFVWKHKDLFEKSNYTFIPKTNEEAIKYFQFCTDFSNVDIFDVGYNELVYIFGKFIPIEKVMDLLDKQNGEIGELPRDVLEMILIELNKIQNL